MTNYEIKTDHDGQPMLCRKIQGRNADSMTGSEVIARGQSEILELHNMLSQYWEDERNRRIEASGTAVKHPLTSQWSDSPPKVPGEYWWRETAESVPMLAIVAEWWTHSYPLGPETMTFKAYRNGRQVFKGCPDKVKGQWQGPISPRG